MTAHAMTPQQFAALTALAKRELRRERRARELELLNRHADALNAESDDSATYQAPWDTRLRMAAGEV